MKSFDLYKFIKKYYNVINKYIIIFYKKNFINNFYLFDYYINFK